MVKMVEPALTVCVAGIRTQGVAWGELAWALVLAVTLLAQTAGRDLGGNGIVGREVGCALALLGSTAFVLRNVVSKGGGSKGGARGGSAALPQASPKQQQAAVLVLEGDDDTGGVRAGDRSDRAAPSAVERTRAPSHDDDDDDASGADADTLTAPGLLCVACCVSAAATAPTALVSLWTMLVAAAPPATPLGAAPLVSLLAAAGLTAAYQAVSMHVLTLVAPVHHSGLNMLKRFGVVVYSFYIEGLAARAALSPARVALLAASALAQYQLMPRAARCAPIDVGPRAVALRAQRALCGDGRGRELTPSGGRGAVYLVTAAALAAVFLFYAPPAAAPPWLGSGGDRRSARNGAPNSALGSFVASTFSGGAWSVGLGTTPPPDEATAPPVPRSAAELEGVLVVRASVEELGCADSCAAGSLAGAGADGARVTLLSAVAPSYSAHVPSALPRVHHSALEVGAVLAGTPLARWGAAHPVWKLMAGPLFPQQLQYALQLALLWKRGGVVAAADLVWPDAARALEAGAAACAAGAELVALRGSGDAPHPALLSARAPGAAVVAELMEHLAVTLDACRGTAAFACVSTVGEIAAAFWNSPRCAGGAAGACERVCVLGEGARVHVGDVCREPLDAKLSNVGGGDGRPVSFADCERTSLSGGIHPQSPLGAALHPRTQPFNRTALSAALEAATAGVGPAPEALGCSLCSTLPHWRGGRRRVTAALAFRTPNIGDEIQSIAAVGFLSRVDAFLDRDSFHVRAHPGLIAPITENTEVSFIANGWWKSFSKPDGTIPLDYKLKGSSLHWPFPARLRPFMIAMHLDSDSTTMDDKVLRLTKDYEAIGARDEHSAERARRVAAHEAFWTACLTLTLKRSMFVPEGAPRNTTVLVLPTHKEDEKLMRSLLPEQNEKALWLSQLIPLDDARANFKTPLPFFGVAVARLAQLASARLVVSSRLHVTLPCIGMDTPVLFVFPYPKDSRYTGFMPTLAPVRNIQDPRLATFPWGSEVVPVTPSHVLLRDTVRAHFHSLFLAIPEYARASFLFNCSA